MTSRVTFDPTAGETARRIRELPGRARPILDPTDPRCGVVVPEQVESDPDPRRRPVTSAQSSN